MMESDNAYVNSCTCHCRYSGGWHCIPFGYGGRSYTCYHLSRYAYVSPTDTTAIQTNSTKQCNTYTTLGNRMKENVIQWKYNTI